MEHGNLKEYQLVQYCPMTCGGPTPSPLGPCTDKLPWEKRQEAEKEKDEKRKKQQAQASVRPQKKCKN